MAGAIKQGHIPAVCPIGFKRVDKKLVPDPLTKDIEYLIYILKVILIALLQIYLIRKKYKVKLIGKIQEY